MGNALLYRFFGAPVAGSGRGPRKKAVVQEEKTIELDYKKLQATLLELQEMSDAKRKKAQKYREKAHAFRKRKQMAEYELNASIFVQLNAQALEVDTIRVRLDSLFELIEQQKITQSSFVVIRESIQYIESNLHHIDIDGADTLASELSEVLEKSREITNSLISDPLNGAKPIHYREFENFFPAEVDDETIILDSDNEEDALPSLSLDTSGKNSLLARPSGRFEKIAF